MASDSLEFDPEAEFIPTPRRTKTKKTEALRLLADIEFDGKAKHAKDSPIS